MTFVPEGYGLIGRSVIRDICDGLCLRCCCEIPASPPVGTIDRSLARSAWKSATQPPRPVGYGVIGRGYSQRYFSSKCPLCFLRKANTLLKGSCPMMFE